MTEENYNYRTSQALLRNQFPGNGKLKIPIIPMFQEKPGDFDDLLLIGFDKTHLEDQNHLDRMVHFFLYVPLPCGAIAGFQYVPGDGACHADLQCIS